MRVILHICYLLLVCMCILWCEPDYLYLCRHVFWWQLRFLFWLPICRFEADSAKSTVCEPLNDNYFDEVCKDLEMLLGNCTFSEWLMFFKTVVLDKVKLVGLDTLFTALFVPCPVSASFLILTLLVGIIVLSLEFIVLLLEMPLTT